LVSSERPGRLFDVKWHVCESLFNIEVDDSDEDDERFQDIKNKLDQSWNEGYGFNNPNAKGYRKQP
jgi:hypothetical protein